MSYIIHVNQVQTYIRITDGSGNEIASLSFSSKNSMLTIPGTPVPPAARSLSHLRPFAQSRAATPAPGIAPEPQTFTVDWAPSNKQVRIVKFPALGSNALFNWQSTATNSLQYLPDDINGTQLFNIDPAPFLIDSINKYPFYKTGTTMVFEIEGTTISKEITVDMTHYNLIATGIVSGKGIETKTATIRSNAPWNLAIDDPAGILKSELLPESGPANTEGVSYTYDFSGATDGSATFTFTPQVAGQFDDVIMSIRDSNIASRFAMSNIVMAKNTFTGDRMLTFAETEDDLDPAIGKSFARIGLAEPIAIPANAQGVFFRWGSLVAIAGLGEITASQVNNIDMTVGGEGVVFTPPELAYTPAATWLMSYTQIFPHSADEIPYLDAEKDPAIIPLYENNQDTELSIFDELYPTLNASNTPIGYDAATGKGDICKYISDKGWVTGRWRMPTYQDYVDLTNETSYNMGTSIGYGVGMTSDTPGQYPLPQGPDKYGFAQVQESFLLGAGVTGVDDPAKPMSEATVVFPASFSVQTVSTTSLFPSYWAWGLEGIYPSSTIMYGSLSWATDQTWGLGGFYYLSSALSINIASITIDLDAMTVRCIREEEPLP
jgi:hypothetical protein